MPRGYSNKTGKSLLPSYTTRRPELRGYDIPQLLGREYEAVDEYTTMDESEVYETVQGVIGNRDY